VRIVQLVPRLPPPAEGVGSYALALAGALETACGVESRFLAAAPPPAGGWDLDGFAASPLSSGLAEAEVVLLHYANYGYQRRGCPVWLARAVRRWRRGEGRRLVTVFHEVYATGPPWRSSFWTFPLQRQLAAAVARTSDAVVTSLDLYSRRIGPAATPAKTSVTPVFSTVGEPPNPPPLAARARRMVLFGGRGARARAYGELRPALAAACRSLEIEEIADVGPPLGIAAEAAETIDGIPIRRHGVLSASKAGALLLDSLAGFVAYPPFFLPKSTIFAAYCAHGVLPVCSWPRAVPDGEVSAGRHYWRPGAGGDPQGIATAARTWYESHSLPVQTEVFRRLLAP
jgi:hypothetical protein